MLGLFFVSAPSASPFKFYRLSGVVECHLFSVLLGWFLFWRLRWSRAVRWLLVSM